MSRHVPFAYNAKDAKLVQAVFPDSEVVRLSLETAPRVLQVLGEKMGLWIDGAVDGFGRWPGTNDSWTSYIQRFEGWDQIGEPAFQQSPKASTVERFVREVLTECLKVAPAAAWLSVPQLPATNDSSRNKINRALAEATAKWRAGQRKFRGRLILPVILTHQKQANLKTNRNQKIKLAAQCFERAGADGYWVVETTLSDQTGAGTFHETRFPGLVCFHQELAQELKVDGPSVAGPYWGLNLVLWARGLITHPAIGLGNGYQYHLPGGTPKAAKRRIALAPLRRWAIANADLQAWLAGLPKADAALRELRDLASTFSKYNLEDEARGQVARFYKSWFDKIASAQASGRALALYQDLSTAYVLGRPLPALPDDEGTARRPERIAEQFMLQCL